MSSPGSRTIDDIIPAVKATAILAADVGVVLTDQRLISSDREALSLIESQNGGTAKGILITLDTVGQRDSEDGDAGLATSQIQQTFGFRLDFIYPYNDKLDINNKNSWTRYREAIADLILQFNSHRTLGILDGSNPDNTVRNQKLQSAQAIQVVSFGTGSDAIICHVGMFRLAVLVDYYMQHPEV